MTYVVVAMRPLVYSVIFMNCALVTVLNDVSFYVPRGLIVCVFAAYFVVFLQCFFVTLCCCLSGE